MGGSIKKLYSFTPTSNWRSFAMISIVSLVFSIALSTSNINVTSDLLTPGVQFSTKFVKMTIVALHSRWLIHVPQLDDVEGVNLQNAMLRISRANLIH